MKWVIGLDKEELTIQSTTQDNMILSLKPLKRHSRTGFLSQRIHSKLEVLHGHTIFKGQNHSWEYMPPDFQTWRIFQIDPMSSKSDTGTTLDRINPGVGVENEILMDNAPDNTGYNT